MANPNPPVVTEAPDAARVAAIMGRQAIDIVTCGYVDANFAEPVTCATGSTCASNVASRVHYCCHDPDNCVMPTTCYASTDLANGLCDNSCESNTSILKCTDSGFENCYTRFWEDVSTLTGFGCAPTPLQEHVYTTYSGEDVPTTGSATSTPSTSTPTTTGGPSSDGGGGASNVSIPVGGIVGIAVGGFLLILIAVVLLVPRARRAVFKALGCGPRQKSETDISPSSTLTPKPQPPPPQPQPQPPLPHPHPQPYPPPRANPELQENLPPRQGPPRPFSGFSDDSPSLENFYGGSLRDA